ncbi:PEGA domain-containing protein [Pseudorhodoplanes sinuspersici]|uniref:Translation initiation factor 2 n=1 Tax=Pseudorhodoplanes sinuspersici TaxID=1235591 RepID=A0A1W6ZUV9_9HYPH|nr:PEGA domain-containing protein [Pseudorhodoplanes sinuspersici]ARQ01229.1 translation initiation factor 2 [Pseudorhodoplanes sinuspersici]RKE72899.1 PEGA domain-containing protein [Pseudorhodoplanes sinuspersici]
MRTILIVGFLALNCAGCASATRGWTEQITITSTPAGAEATVTGPEVPTTCVTPCVVQVKRNDDVSVAFSKEGYEPQVITLTKEVASGGAAGFAGNILVGGLVGMAVDGASGAAYDHKPNPVIVTLKPVAPPPAPPSIMRRRTPKPPTS